MLYILKQLFASVSVNSGGYLPRRSGSVNIHRYSPPLRRIIVNYPVDKFYPLDRRLIRWIRVIHALNNRALKSESVVSSDPSVWISGSGGSAVQVVRCSGRNAVHPTATPTIGNHSSTRCDDAAFDGARSTYHFGLSRQVESGDQT